MSFYNRLLREDQTWEGLESPRPSTSSLIIDLANMEERTPEEKAERKARLDAALEKCVKTMCGRAK